MELLYDTIGRFVALATGGLAILFAAVMRPWWRRDFVQAWIAAYGLLTLGLALFAVPASDQTTPGLVFHAVRNGCLLLASGYQLWGWARVLGLAWPWQVAWVPMVVLVSGYLTLGSTYGHRVVVMGLVMAFTSVAHLWVLRKALPPSMLRLGGMVRAVLMGHIAFRLIRVSMAWGQTGQESLFRWTAYAFLELFAVFAVMAFLEWAWVEQWEEDRAKEPRLSS